MQALWLSGLGLLIAPDQPCRQGDALIAADGRLLALGEEAADQGRRLGLQPQTAAGWLLAPPLVDPHSVLEEPLLGRAETLSTLTAAALAGGYGSLGLLPWARPWRDRPEALSLPATTPLKLRLWGSFSLAGDDQGLAPHAEQLAAGAVGVAAGAALPPPALLERAFTLADWGPRPLLLAPRLRELSGGGFVRACVESLRAGWLPDPAISELAPLELLRGLVQAAPLPALVLMNLSTAVGVEQLRAWPEQQRPAATVSWWHLLADAGSSTPATSGGWRLEPSLGAPADRLALQRALAEGLIDAVAVHHLPLDREEQLLPLDQRRPGLAGHGGPVLPLLWQELVEGQQWPVERLWQVLSWRPARLLGDPPETLALESHRWLLFDPACSWCFEDSPSLAANQPWLGQPLRGRIRASGFSASSAWQL